jgi:hypothetical protein
VTIAYSERFDKFAELLRQRIPGVAVKYKNESVFMKVLSGLLFFVPDFMTKFATTIGKTIYFPSRENIETSISNASLVTLAHEGRHAWDGRTFFKSFFWSSLYLLPQVLAPFMWFFAFWSVIFAAIAFVVLLLPIPSPGRMAFELKGSITTLFILNELQKEVGWPEDLRHAILLSSVESTNKSFTGINYYFMWPFGVKDQLASAVEEIVSGRIMEKDEFYKNLAEDVVASR